LRQCGRTTDGWSALTWMEKMMNTERELTSTTSELSLAELELVSGGLIHEETHAADSPNHGGGGRESSWFLALANAMGDAMNRYARGL
jgi:hypothetical protein